MAEDLADQLRRGWAAWRQTRPDTERGQAVRKKMLELAIAADELAAANKKEESA